MLPWPSWPDQGGRSSTKCASNDPPFVGQDFPLLGFRFFFVGIPIIVFFSSGERAQTRGTPGDGNSHGKLDGGDQVTDSRHDDDDGEDGDGDDDDDDDDEEEEGNED